MFWDKKMETLKRGDLQELQLKRLKKTLNQYNMWNFTENCSRTLGSKIYRLKQSTT